MIAKLRYAGRLTGVQTNLITPLAGGNNTVYMQGYQQVLIISLGTAGGGHLVASL